MPQTLPTISPSSAGALRDALAASARGELPAVAYALMSIDPASWEVIKGRFADLGIDMGSLLAAQPGLPMAVGTAARP